MIVDKDANICGISAVLLNNTQLYFVFVQLCLPCLPHSTCPIYLYALSIEASKKSPVKVQRIPDSTRAAAAATRAISRGTC